ncbi:unnamed protein product, partial [Heterotrigona itama]
EIIANLPPLRIPRLRHHRVTDWDPYFENAEGQGINGSQNVALHLGATALLDCRVAMLSGKKVMWLRRNADWASLLTLGNTTHISDPRYSVSFQYPNNWRLAIAGVRREDRGLYVCQVNTHPPRMLVTNVTVLGSLSILTFPLEMNSEACHFKIDDSSLSNVDNSSLYINDDESFDQGSLICAHRIPWHLKQAGEFYTAPIPAQILETATPPSNNPPDLFECHRAHVQTAHDNALLPSKTNANELLPSYSSPSIHEYLRPIRSKSSSDLRCESTIIFS